MFNPRRLLLLDLITWTTGNIRQRRVGKIGPRLTLASMKYVFEITSAFVREGDSEQAIYPRVQNILAEVVDIYKHQIPCTCKVFINPVLTFPGTTGHFGTYLSSYM